MGRVLITSSESANRQNGKTDSVTLYTDEGGKKLVLLKRPTSMWGPISCILQIFQFLHLFSLTLPLHQMNMIHVCICFTYYHVLCSTLLLRKAEKSMIQPHFCGVFANKKNLDQQKRVKCSKTKHH